MATYRIPLDVVAEILVGLPVKTILRLKSVCKDWCTLINTPPFIQLHLNNSILFKFGNKRTLLYANDDSLCVVDDIYCPSKPIKLYWPKQIIRNSDYLRIVGSCNGLVCLSVTTDIYHDSEALCFLICNPSTHTFKFKPNFPFSGLKPWEINGLSYGFGYDSKHDDYKIVVTRNYLKDYVRDDVYIYSFKADSWKCATRTLAEGSIQICRPKLYKSVVCASNMLHYLAHSLVDKDNNDPNFRIARFDLSSETWRDDLSFPPVEEGWTYIDLGVLDDCLYLCLAERRGVHNVWVMKGYRDEDYSWSIKFNIPENFHNLTLFAASKEGPLGLLFVRKYFGSGRVYHLSWYNPYDNSTESFELEKSASDSFFHHCITSLVTIPGSSFNYRASRKRLR